MTTNKTNKKRILMIGPDDAGMGGMATVVNIYRQAGMFDRYRVRYIVSHRVGGAICKLRSLVLAWLATMHCMLRGRIGLMHVHTASDASFWRKTLFLLPAFVFGVPTILHVHGATFRDFFERECGPVRRSIVRFVLRHCSRVIALSATWKDWIIQASPGSRVDVIYNAVFVPSSVVAWEQRQPGAVLSLGVLGKRKGSYDLVAAAARVLANRADVHLRLGGDGELDQVAAHAKALGVADRVALLGWVRDADRDRQLASASVYALPSYHEGLPMSVLEAMAAGLPILSTPVGGIPEAVTHGVEGFLVPPGDVECIARHLERLLSEPGLAQRMGEAARRKIQCQFSVDAMLPKLERLYAELGVRA